MRLKLFLDNQKYDIFGCLHEATKPSSYRYDAVFRQYPVVFCLIHYRLHNLFQSSNIKSISLSTLRVIIIWLYMCFFCMHVRPLTSHSVIMIITSFTSPFLIQHILGFAFSKCIFPFFIRIFDWSSHYIYYMFFILKLFEVRLYIF